MVTGSDLGFGKFRFDFKMEEKLEEVLKQQPFHFDYWMLSQARWQPKQSRSFPSEIMFFGIPLEFRTVPTFESIGGALGRVVAVDVTLNRVQVELCPLKEKNAKSSPARRRETREGTGGWFDGTKHEEQARSYKGVVINGHTGQQHKGRDSREYYGKGKGKMVDAADSKWVKAAERGSRKPPTHHGYRVGDQEPRIRPSSEQSTDDQRQRVPGPKAWEEGEIKSNGDDVAILPYEGFQLELAETQAEGSEVIMEASEAEKGLIALQGMMEKHDYMAEDIDMELEAINATILESGVESEAEEEFQTLSEEEAELASEVQQKHVHTQEEEELGSGDANAEKDTTAGSVATRQSNRKRFVKPTISMAGSNKMRMTSVLVSPRKRVAAKVGTRHGDSGKPPESKGPSNPKPVLFKF
ncbi:hypothetical protein Bca101_098136 [Brassica carinata]